MYDLGRVVVPKELRRTMKISEGTPLEIFIDKDGSIIFRKYSPVGELNESAKNMAECFFATRCADVLGERIQQKALAVGHFRAVFHRAVCVQQILFHFIAQL